MLSIALILDTGERESSIQMLRNFFGPSAACVFDVASSPGWVVFVSKITLGHQLGLVKIAYACSFRFDKFQ